MAFQLHGPGVQRAAAAVTAHIIGDPTSLAIPAAAACGMPVGSISLFAHQSSFCANSSSSAAPATTEARLPLFLYKQKQTIVAV